MDGGRPWRPVLSWRRKIFSAPFFAFLTVSCAAFFLALGTPEARAENVFEIQGITAEAAADNPSAARDAALATAQKSGLGQLLARLGGDAARSLADGLTEEATTALVQDFAVESEKITAKNYNGVFTVRYRPDGVRALLAGRAVDFSEVASSPLLILPIAVVSGRAILFEERTPWRAAWDDPSILNGLVPLIVPEGDLQDVTLISGAEALAGDSAKLDAIARKYQAGGVLIATVTTDGKTFDPASPINAQWQRRDVGSVRGTIESLAPPLPASTSPAAGVGGKKTMPDLSVRFSQLRDQMVSAMQAQWRRDTAGFSRTNSGLAGTAPHLASEAAGSAGIDAGAASGQPLVVRVPVEDLTEWTNVETRLRQLPAVSSLQIDRFSRKLVQLRVLLRGTLSQAVAQLADEGYRLSPLADGTYQLLAEMAAAPVVIQ